MDYRPLEAQVSALTRASSCTAMKTAATIFISSLTISVTGMKTAMEKVLNMESKSLIMMIQMKKRCGSGGEAAAEASVSIQGRQTLVATTR